MSFLLAFRIAFVAGVLLACLALPFLSSAQQKGEPVVPWVISVAFSPDGKLLAAGAGKQGQPGSAMIYDLMTRQLVWKHREKDGVPTVAFSRDGRTLALGSYANVARLLDATNGKEKVTLPHPNEVRALTFSPDGKLLATACWDGVLRTWDPDTGAEKKAYKGPRGRIYGVQFSPDGTLLLASGVKEGVKLWDVATATEKRTFTHGFSSSNLGLFTPDGRWLITGAGDATVRLWNLETGEQRVRFNVAGTNGAYSPQAKALAVAYIPKVVRVLDLSFDEPTAKEQELIRSLIAKLDDDSYDLREATSQELVKLGFLAEAELGRTLKETTSAEVRIRVRQIREQLLTQPRWTFDGHTEPVDAVAFSPDGKHLATGGRDGTVRLWNLTTGKEEARWAAD